MDADVVVVGGGAAGLAAAQVLGRSRRSVVVVDAGDPRNAPADGAHGLLALDGIAPLELLARGRAEVEAYGGRIVRGSAVAAREDGDAFVVDLADGGSLTARRLVAATGVRDELPDVPGLRERWGRDVLHCPYCHGWEHRDQRIVVIATTPFAGHQAQLFRQLTDHVTVVSNGLELPDRDTLAARGIEVVDGPAEEVVVRGDAIVGVRVWSAIVGCDAVAVGSTATARAEWLAPLGVVTEDVAFGDVRMGTIVPTDAQLRTRHPKVWAAGNLTDLRAQVPVTAGHGVLVAANVNADLVAEEVAAALSARR